MDNDHLEARLDRLERQLTRVLGLLENQRDVASRYETDVTSDADVGGANAVAEGRPSIRLANSSQSLYIPGVESSGAPGRGLVQSMSKGQAAPEGGPSATAAGGLAKADLGAPGAVEALVRLGFPPGAVAPVGEPSPASRATATAVAELARVEGAAALEARLHETLVALVEPETLDSLTRIASLAPKLEYATYFLAAGPELLEEALEVVKKRMGEEPMPYPERALETAVEIVRAVAQPQALAGLSALAGRLPRLVPADPAFGTALEDLVGKLPQLAQLMAAVDLEKLTTLVQKLDLEKVDPERLGALLDKIEPDQLVALLDKVDFEVIGELVEALDLEGLIDGPLPTLKLAGEHLADADKRDALIGLIELAPQLERPLRALPVQPATIQVLSAVNEAVEEAAHTTRSLGLLGTVGALRDPEVQRAVGFVMQVAKNLGRALDEPSKALPAPRDAAAE